MLKRPVYLVSITVRCLLVAAALLAQSGCERSGETQAPPELADGWAVAAPADVGFDEATLTQCKELTLNPTGREARPFESSLHA